MKRAATLAALIALAAPQGASAFDYTIHANGRMSAANVARVEHAVSFQVNVQVAQDWPIDSAVTFSAAGGAPIYLTTQAEVDREYVALGGAGNPDDVAGWHYWENDQPYIVVTGADFADTAEYISHEVIESSVDPSGHSWEICDPVDTDAGYHLWDVHVADWITRAGKPFN